MAYDKEKVKSGVEMIIEGIGHPKDDPNITETPERVAKMYEILFGGYDTDPKKYLKFFPSTSKTSVNVANIPFYSFCAHHMMPFFGKMHVGYVPNGKVVGLSKLARIPRVFAKRFNLQEDMTQNIADFLYSELGADGLIVRIEANHTCMTLRGVRSPGTATTTTIKKGSYETDKELVHEFEQSIKSGSVFNY